MNEVVVLKEDSHKNITYATLIQAFFTSLSRVFGMINNVIMLHVFGASFVTDAFWMAYTIPNVLRRFFAEGSLSMAFVPVYLQTKEDDKDKAKDFFRDTLGFLLITLFIITVLCIFSSSILVKMFAYGFTDNAYQFSITNTMTKWLFPYVFMVSIVALFGAYLQCHKKFAAMSASPILLNISMILSMIFLSSFFMPSIYCLIVGVLLGGLCQIILMIFALYKNSLLVSPRFNFKTQAMKKLMRLLGPALFGVFVYQLNIIVLRQLASFLGEGQITYYSNADRLTQLISGVFGASIAAAALPQLSIDVSKSSLKQLFNTLEFSLKLNSFIITPCALGLLIFAKPIVAIVYFHGAFNFKDAHFTAITLMGFAPSLISFGFSRAVMQAYYALNDTKTPVIIGFFTVFINLILGVLLFNYAVLGLALTLSVSSFFQYYLLIFYLKKKVGDEYDLKINKTFLAHLAISLVACMVGLLIQNLGNFSIGFSVYNACVLGLMALCCGTCYFSFCYYFGFKEAKTFFSMLTKKIKMPK